MSANAINGQQWSAMGSNEQLSLVGTLKGHNGWVTAIATTTASGTGLVMFELLKVLQKKPVEHLRNGTSISMNEAWRSAGAALGAQRGARRGGAEAGRRDAQHGARCLLRPAGAQVASRGAAGAAGRVPATRSLAALAPGAPSATR